jgi:hypothetical protein
MPKRRTSFIFHCLLARRVCVAVFRVARGSPRRRRLAPLVADTLLHSAVDEYLNGDTGNWLK